MKNERGEIQLVIIINKRAKYTGSSRLFFFFDHQRLCTVQKSRGNLNGLLMLLRYGYLLLRLIIVLMIKQIANVQDIICDKFKHIPVTVTLQKLAV